MKLDILYGKGMGANTYLLTDSGEGVLVDCAASADNVTMLLDKRGAALKYILLTHGHFDHIMTLESLRSVTGAKVLIHKADDELLGDSVKNAYSVMYRSGELVARSADVLLDDGAKIDFAGGTVGLIHTPGHTKGSSAYFIESEKMLFSGDTLFCQNVGRTDLYGGDAAALLDSLRRIAELDPETAVYPGHGSSTAIGAELDVNYYMSQALDGGMEF